MEEKKAKKISISTIFLILAIIAMIVMGIFIYKLNNEKTSEIQKSTELQELVNSLNETVSDLQGKIDSISNTINNNSETNTTVDTTTQETPNPKNNYEGESFIGYYQLLNEEYFSISKYDSNKYTTLDLEIQLLSNGTAKVAYRLEDNGNYTSKQYNANYTLEKVDEMEIDGDHYRSLKLTYTSDEVNKDDVISSISNYITYNPANNPTDGTEAFPKSLVMRGGAGNLIPRMVKSSEIKYLK